MQMPFEPSGPAGALSQYERVQGMPALRLVETPGLVRRVVLVTLALFIIAVVSLVFVPWFQTVLGNGRVIAYSNTEREFTVEATMKGNIDKVFVNEGKMVKKGEALFELVANDPNYKVNLQFQLDAALQKVAAYKVKKQAYEDNVRFTEQARDAAIQAANVYVEISSRYHDMEKAELAANEALLVQYGLFRDQSRTLNRAGLEPGEKVWKADAEFKDYTQKVEKSKQKVQAALRGIDEAKAKLREKTEEYAGKIAKANGDLQGAIADLQGEEKAANEAKSKLAQFDTQTTIRATADGMIHRVNANGVGQSVKEGDVLCVIVPDTESRAVELLVDGNDIPLVHKGDEVRLQFEGWPAVQFSGWPSVAIGTFGGRVSFVDPTDAGKGKFRIVVVPDERNPFGGEQPWPAPQYLRQGVRAKGWVMLRSVPLYQEVWRQMNGFPPVLSDDPLTSRSDDKSKGKGSSDDKEEKKEPKLPKLKT
jgi:multidrug efflux pump subunit AcrA (membrane-fusion protein)